MKKILCAMLSVLMCCSVMFCGVFNVDSVKAAAVDKLFSNQKSLIFGEETVDVSNSPYGEKICRELKVTSPMVITFKPTFEDVTRGSITIGTNLIDYNVSWQGAPENPKQIGDTLYSTLFNEDNKTTQFYLGKGTYYIMIMAHSNVNSTFTYEFTKESPSKYQLDTLKYSVNLRGGTWLGEKSVSKTIKMIRGGVKPYIYKNYMLNKPVKTGYRFTGFTTKRESDGKWLYEPENHGLNLKWFVSGKNSYDYIKYIRDYIDFDHNRPLDFNETYKFYANWKANKFTIQYHANGGTGTMKDTKAVYGEANKLRTNTFKRNGYTFGGWFVKRKSDNKWLYTNGTAKKWYVAGKEPKGYKRVVYKTEASLSKITSTNGAVIGVYAKWNKNK